MRASCRVVASVCLGRDGSENWGFYMCGPSHQPRIAEIHRSGLHMLKRGAEEGKLCFIFCFSFFNLLVSWQCWSVRRGRGGVGAGSSRVIELSHGADRPAQDNAEPRKTLVNSAKEISVTTSLFLRTLWPAALQWGSRTWTRNPNASTPSHNLSINSTWRRSLPARAAGATDVSLRVSLLRKP